jgi:hypothetical protein
MLLDKWTAGEVRISKDRLRALSGDRAGGSGIDHLRTAFRRIDHPIQALPNGGTGVTWDELRDRLASGGGAVVLGDYGDLPRRFARWDPSFWALTGDGDNHAMYLDGYDPKGDRFWVMDPLAPVGWTGEWIPARDIRSFTWRAANGALSAVVTPPAEPAPFAGIEFLESFAYTTDDGLRVAWPLATLPADWTLPNAEVVATAERLEDGLVLPDLKVAAAVPVTDTAAATPTALSLELAGNRLTASVPIPTEPGAYRVDAQVREPRFGRTVAGSGAVTVYVPGPRRAQLAVVATTDAAVAAAVRVQVTVTNTGSMDWADAIWPSAIPLEEYIARDTRIVATWLAMDVATDPLAPGRIDATPFGLDRLPLAPGASLQTVLIVPTPPTTGRWVLMLDVVDDVSGSFAAAGSRPGSLVVTLAERPNPLVE